MDYTILEVLSAVFITVYIIILVIKYKKVTFTFSKSDKKTDKNK